MSSHVFHRLSTELSDGRRVPTDKPRGTAGFGVYSPDGSEVLWVAPEEIDGQGDNVVADGDLEDVVEGEWSYPAGVADRIRDATVPGAADAALDWFSDWRDSTGTSTAALRDGTGGAAKWTDESSSSDVLEVIAATSLDFPTTNVLRVDIDSEAARKVVATEQWAAPAVGEFLFMRYYVRSAVAQGEVTGSPHHVESHVGDIAWAWNQPATETGDLVPLGFYSQADGYYALEGDDRLALDTTYRVEWRLERTATGVAKAKLRVYSSAGTLLADENDFMQDGTSWATANPDVTVNNVSEDLRSVNCGQSGQAGSTADPGNYVYFGAFAARQTDDGDAWIGAYPVSGQED